MCYGVIYFEGLLKIMQLKKMQFDSYIKGTENDIVEMFASNYYS